MTKRLSWEERWFAKVTPLSDDECWEFAGARDRAGYGLFWNGESTERPRTVGAHRWAFARFVGPIPDGMDVLHSCDNPPCVNPSHLRVGSHADNMRDAVGKGRFSGKDAGGRHLKSRKMTWDRVRELRARATGERGEAARLADEFGIGVSMVHYILKGQRWAE